MHIRHLLIGLFLTLASCTTYEKVLTSKDVNYKLTKANEYYDKGRYFEASKVYESLLPALRGTKNYEELYYRYAYSFYNNKDYINAAYQFKNFQEFFSKSDRLEEMQYMYAVSLFKNSLKASLDQTETQNALSALQTFLIMNPNSKYREEANEYIDEANFKLETKASSAAKQYFDQDYYREASVAYKTLIFDFPDSKQLDFYYYMLIRSLYFYADNSKESLKRERFLDMEEYYDVSKRYFPNSQYTKDIEELYNNSQKKLKQITK